MGALANDGAGISLSPSPLPSHTAIAIDSSMSLVEATLRNIIEILQLAIALKLPMLTFQIATSRTEHEVDTIVTLFTALMHEQMLDQHQIKVSVIGKWYELPERAVEPIKHVITATRDYDGHFVNICVRYDGQEEIIDGAKLLAKHVQLGKLAPEQITKEALKEAMLTSTLLPPALIIIPAPAKKTNGVLLWDSSSATVHFSDTPWQDFGKNAFLESVRFFQQHTQSTHT